MSSRAVSHSRKDQQGNITALGNPNGSWSPRLSSDIIRDIESGFHTYYGPWTTGSTQIRVVNGGYGKYLRTDSDGTTRNNLDDLSNI